MSKKASHAAHEALLRELQIDDSHPGTILRDFQMLLDYVVERQPVLTKTRLLPMECPPEINARLVHPIRIDLKRPKQKSFPQVNGLFLILRSTGLGQTRFDGKHYRLILDPRQLAQWQALNPTERYFTLLDGWLLSSDPKGAIGETGIRDCLGDCQRFFRRWHGKVIHTPLQRDQDEQFKYAPGYFNLALLEMFGLVQLEQIEPETESGWRLSSARFTPLGKALFAILEDYSDELFSRSFRLLEESDEEDSEGEDEAEEPAKFDAFHPIFAPCFPEWTRQMETPYWDYRPGEYRFKVSLSDKVWRRIAIPGDAYWDDMASAILDAFNFENDHLYRFIWTDPTGSDFSLNHYRMEEGPDAQDVAIGSLPLEVGEELIFHYDFGDDWRFTLRLEERLPESPRLKKAKVLEKAGKAPEQYPRWDADND